MTEPVKPISAKSLPKTDTPKPEESKTVKIGNVEFRKNQIIEDKTRTYTDKGKKMNTVFVKPGVQIDFPDQNNPNKKPSVESRGLRSEWYNPDDSYITINDLENAKIYGAPNKSDFIDLRGKSTGNEIFVNQRESWYINSDMRKDYVDLGWDTSDNTVHMDEKDKTTISYNRPEVIMNGKQVQSSIGHIEVEGEGTSEQELQLKHSLTKSQYQEHKLKQKYNNK